MEGHESKGSPEAGASAGFRPPLPRSPRKATARRFLLYCPVYVTFQITPKRSSPHAIPSIGLLVSHSRTGLMYPFGFGLATINGTPRTPSTWGGKRYGGIWGTHGLSPM